MHLILQSSMFYVMCLLLLLTASISGASENVRNMQVDVNSVMDILETTKGEKEDILRNSSVGMSGMDETKSLNLMDKFSDNLDEDDIPKVLPTPKMYRWFPENHGPPAEDRDAGSGEKSQTYPGKTLEPEDISMYHKIHQNNRTKEETMPSMLSAVQEEYATHFEDTEGSNEDGEILLQSPGMKSHRVRRATLSIEEIRRRRRKNRRKQAKLEANRTSTTANTVSMTTTVKPATTKPATTPVNKQNTVRSKTYNKPTTAKPTSAWKTFPRTTRKTITRKPTHKPTKPTTFRRTKATSNVKQTAVRKNRQRSISTVAKKAKLNPTSRAPHLRNVRNKSTKVTFTRWSVWRICNARLCGTTGRQMRQRTCYVGNLPASSYSSCNYNSLVNYKPCTASPCSISKKPVERRNITAQRSIWSEWSKCDITCGTGGRQTRNRLCFTFSKLANGTNIMSSINCQGKIIDTRPCQYSVSCPIWEEWNSWSPCSQSCGNGGVTFRERKCIVERYVPMRFMSDPAKGNFERINPEVNQTQLFDAKSNGRKPKGINEPSKKNVAKATKKAPNKPPPTKARPRQMKQGLVFLNENEQEVYIVDAQLPKRDAELPTQMNAPQLHKENAVREIVNSRLCEEEGGVSEEERRCVVKSKCPPTWGAWEPWSPCSVSCGTGISRTERKCNGDSPSNPCTGRKYSYRRCYSPPCWSGWTAYNSCSVSCGAKSGYKIRTRKCYGTTPVVPQYTSCNGKASQVEACNQAPCPADNWSEWSNFESCSKSCNGGYKRRRRECSGKSCSGVSEDFGRCNVQECPTWSKWSVYSCCSVSCGRGTRERLRTCAHGNAGDKGCIGKSTDVEFCYMKSCNETFKKSVFHRMKCGMGSVSNLKNVAQLRIYGGTIATKHDWPWQLSWQHRVDLESDWQHFCGATLIHPRWVITASHCTEESEYTVNHKNPGENWSVVVGMEKLYKDGMRYFVDRIFVHPKYEYRSVTKNDVALLKLRRMVPLTKEVMPACLPKMSRPVPGEKCFVTGWGYTYQVGGKVVHSCFVADPKHLFKQSSSDESLLSLSLREASIPIMKFSECRALGDYYRYFLDNTMHMCAGNPITASSDSCTGDSGGPLVCSRNKRWYIAAVTSFGFADCGTPGEVGIYAPMNTYEEWVRNIVETNTYERC